MERQLVTPLRKKRLRTEELYTRIPEIEAKLVELEGLSRDRTPCPHSNSSAVMIPAMFQANACSISCGRAARTIPLAGFEQLYKVLAERVLRSLPRAESADGTTTSLTNSVIRDRVFGQIC